MLLMVVGLGSCKKDNNEPTAEPTTEPTQITLDASTLTLQVGESKQLKAIVLPKDQEFTVDYKSDKPEVATVDAKGLVTAVAKGTAKVTATVGKLSAECIVTVTKKDGGSTTQANELPLLKFDIESKEDADVLAHEKKIGRVAENVKIGTQGPFSGFVNKDLMIPAVVYGLAFKDGTKVIVALSKENLADCPKTTAMLAEYGFTNLQDGNFEDGTPYKAATKDDNKSILVQIADLPKEDDYGATMQILFFKLPEKKDIEIAHPVIPNAKDFPDYKTFMTGDAAKMKEFETKLGFREFSATESDEAKKNLMFVTKKASMDQSNFHLVFYVSKPSGGEPFINSIVNFIQNAKDFNDPKLKEWFAANGYGKNFVANDQKGFAYAYDDATGKILAQVFINKKGDAAMLQIFEDTETQSAAQMRRLASEQYEKAQLRMLMKQHELQQLHRR